jgi:2'-5' RNA ligase
VRLFVAVNLSEPLRRPLAEAQAHLQASAADVKWTDPAGFHFTLKFLGEVPAPRLQEMIAAAAGALAGGERFTLGLRGVGGFPTARSPRVVWVGVSQGEPEMAALAGALEAAFAPLGFAPEGRPFSAHLTLGRVRSPQGRQELAARMAALVDRDFGSMPVEQVHLMESRLSPRGASYHLVAAFPLAERQER